MGIAGSWISFSGLSKDEALRRVDYIGTGKMADPDVWLGREENGVVVLPTGQVVIVFSAPRFGPEAEVGFSLGTDLVVGEMEEHVMYSAARLYRDGRLIWSVVHDRETYEEEIVVVEGEAPDSLRALVEEADRKDAEGGGADYHFDVPIKLARQYGGYAPYDDMEAHPLELIEDQVELRMIAANRAREAERRAKREASGGFLGGLKRLFSARAER